MEYSDLIRDYLDDADSHIKAVDAALLALEQNGQDSGLITSLLGSLHTLKGNSGMMGFESLKIYIHQIESLIKEINEGSRGLKDSMDILFNSANVIRTTLQSIGSTPDANPDLTEDMLVLQNRMEGNGGQTTGVSADILSYLGAKTQTIKVDFKRLDALLNLVGELVIYKTRLNQIGTRLKTEVGGKAVLKDLNESLEFMGKAISGVQEGIMKVRMLPVSHVFGKFPRMVRDLARSQGKEINLFFEGEDTELDKTVIDELEEPLLHIIRNSIDHGIETPADRMRSGKTGSGRITLSAGQESNYVIIRVSDDGRGIDLDTVRQKAVDKGMLGPEDQLDRDALAKIIFSAGFTTKQEATDISGRGIGLDVVSRNIAKLNGLISVDSSRNRGTVFTIKLPLSLAIIPALMAETSGEVFAIPMSAVDESIKVREDEIHIINNHEVIRFREKVLPVIRLNEFFGLGGERSGRFYLVILGKAERKIALAVDRLRGQQEIVIKPLDDTFGKSYGIAGASVLGDGKIVLIIDTMSFYEKKEVLSSV